MIRRLARTLVALGLALVAASACAPAPAPGPSPTVPAFATEEEAFAAAETTYRAYVDALNQRRADARSSPDPQSFLIGEALEVDIAARTQLADSGLHIEGPTRIAQLDRRHVDASSGTVTLSVCLDSTRTRVTNASGLDVTPADRPDTVAIDVKFVTTRNGLLIEKSETEETTGNEC